MDGKKKIFKRRTSTAATATSPSSASSLSSPTSGGAIIDGDDDDHVRLSISRSISNKSDEGDGEALIENVDMRGGGKKKNRNINSNKKRTPWRIVALRLFRRESSSLSSLSSLSSIRCTSKNILLLLLCPLCLYQAMLLSATTSFLPSFLYYTYSKNTEPYALYGKHARMLQYYGSDDMDPDAELEAEAAMIRYKETPSIRGNQKIIKGNWTAIHEFVFEDNDTDDNRAATVPPLISRRRQKYLLDPDEKFYERSRYPLEVWETKHCRAQHEWQKATFLNCNTMHELPLNNIMDAAALNNNETTTTMSSSKSKSTTHVMTDSLTSILGNGYYRDVWKVPNPHHDRSDSSDHLNADHVILKSIRYRHNFEPDQFDRNRRDAIAQERLTASQFVTDIYGFCGGSGLFEYGSGGDMKQLLTSNSETNNSLTKLEKFRMGVQAAMAIADVHTVDGGGTAQRHAVAMAHTDISPQQFVRVSHRHHHHHHHSHDEGNRFKLTDFNRMRMIRIDPDRGTTCPFTVKKNAGRLRSPEEYAYLPETPKVDVYSLGNILYMLLTGETRPFDNVDTNTAMEKVKNGERPFVSREIRHSHDPIDRALLHAIEMCFVQEVKKRATALQVADFLKSNLEVIDPGRLESWGVKNV